MERMTNEEVKALFREMYAEKGYELLDICPELEFYKNTMGSVIAYSVDCPNRSWDDGDCSYHPLIMSHILPRCKRLQSGGHCYVIGTKQKEGEISEKGVDKQHKKV